MCFMATDICPFLAFGALTSKIAYETVRGKISIHEVTSGRHSLNLILARSLDFMRHFLQRIYCFAANALLYLRLVYEMAIKLGTKVVFARFN